MTLQASENLIERVHRLSDAKRAAQRVKPRDPMQNPAIWRFYDDQEALIDAQIDEIGRTIETIEGTNAAEMILQSGIIRSQAWAREGRIG